MKKFLSILMVLTLVFGLSACNTESGISARDNSKESLNINDVFLDFNDVSNLVSEYDGTLFVVNPDKTVSVVGINNGNCDVQGWVDIEKIFATQTATFGIKTDGTCMVATNYTSYTKAEYNNAREITDNFVLFEDGTVIPRDASYLEETIPKCIDILEDGSWLLIVTENGEIYCYSFNIENALCELSTRSYGVDDFNEDLERLNLSNIKRLSYSRVYNSFDWYEFLIAVSNDGKVFAYEIGYDNFGYDNIYELDYVQRVPAVRSFVHVGDYDVCIGIGKNNNIIAYGNEFDELGGETPKLLTIDNALEVFSFYGTHNGKAFNYAIIICDDGSVFAYRLKGTFPSNIENAFSKWKSFEIL